MSYIFTKHISFWAKFYYLFTCAREEFICYYLFDGLFVYFYSKFQPFIHLKFLQLLKYLVPEPKFILKPQAMGSFFDLIIASLCDLLLAIWFYRSLSFSISSHYVHCLHTVTTSTFTFVVCFLVISDCCGCCCCCYRQTLSQSTVDSGRTFVRTNDGTWLPSLLRGNVCVCVVNMLSEFLAVKLFA